MASWFGQHKARFLLHVPDKGESSLVVALNTNASSTSLMRTLAYIFPLTAIVIFIQAATGAFTVLNFYDFNSHMYTGYVTGAFALVAAIIAFTGPKYNALRYSSLVLLALVVLQGVMGFSAETSDQLVAVHFVNFLVLFGVSIATIFYSFRWGRMDAAPLAQPK